MPGAGRPQPGNSTVKVAPSRIFPVVVISGQYPVNPLTIRYINGRLTAEGHRPDGACSRSPSWTLKEGCQALLRRKAGRCPSC